MNNGIRSGGVISKVLGSVGPEPTYTVAVSGRSELQEYSYGPHHEKLQIWGSAYRPTRSETPLATDLIAPGSLEQVATMDLKGLISALDLLLRLAYSHSRSQYAAIWFRANQKGVQVFATDGIVGASSIVSGWLNASVLAIPRRAATCIVAPWEDRPDGECCVWQHKGGKWWVYDMSNSGGEASVLTQPCLQPCPPLSHLVSTPLHPSVEFRISYEELLGILDVVEDSKFEVVVHNSSMHVKGHHVPLKDMTWTVLPGRRLTANLHPIGLKRAIHMFDCLDDYLIRLYRNREGGDPVPYVVQGCCNRQVELYVMPAKGGCYEE